MDPYGVLLLYLLVPEGFGFVTCLQNQGEGDQSVTFVSCKLMLTEEKVGQLTFLVSLTGWCLQKL